MKNIIKLADACHNGGCNAQGLCRALGNAMDDLRGLGGDTIRRNPALQVIIGQLNFLTGQGMGSENAVVESYCAWKCDLILVQANAEMDELHDMVEPTPLSHLRTAAEDLGAKLTEQDETDPQSAVIVIHDREYLVMLQDLVWTRNILNKQRLFDIVMTAMQDALGEHMEIEHESKIIERSIKLGEEAVSHTGRKGIAAYFCIEESVLITAYWGEPKLYWAWQECITTALKPYGLFMESINTCEMGIYPA